jgi:glycosyltransferase involved in cell wall biosynthesis
VSTRVSVSAVVITRDAERHLETVLRPLSICAEVVILDSGSTDRTREIAEAAGARWHEHPFDGYGPQKRRAVDLAANDWVLSIDGDEVLDEVAAAGVAAIDWSRQDAAACWRIRRRPFIGTREIRHGHWVPDFVLRLFNRTRHSFTSDLVHESVRPRGPIHTLPGSLLHYSYEDLADLYRADYHRLKADLYRSRGRRASGASLAIRAAAAFLRSYLLRRGFLDGPAGVAVALAGAVGAVTGLAMASDNSTAENEMRPHNLDEYL